MREDLVRRAAHVATRGLCACGALPARDVDESLRLELARASRPGGAYDAGAAADQHAQAAGAAVAAHVAHSYLG